MGSQWLFQYAQNYLYIKPPLTKILRHMDFWQKMEDWADAHHPKWIDFVRIGLGMFLFFKGVAFLADENTLTNILEDADAAFATIAVAHYVVPVHLLGGIFIAFGLITRISVILQIPLLLGAVVINAERGFLAVGNNLEFGQSLVVLLLLLVFTVYGSGKISLDDYMDRHPSV